MADRTPETEHITIRNSLSTVPDSRRAADLFATILRAVREQTAEESKQESGGNTAS
jgi:hypothetical protein